MSARRRAVLILNPAAAQGTAQRKYAAVRSAVESQLDVRRAMLDATGVWQAVLREELSRGTRLVVAAGGDGTVGAVVNAIVSTRSAALGEVTLGAVGLGSSNDFHKPVRQSSARIPLRIDWGGAAPRDVARARFLDGSGTVRERLFVVSASLGLCARASARFNRGDALLRALKPRWVCAAIGYAALATLARHRPDHVRLSVGGEVTELWLDNLSVGKTPHLAGAFRYDTSVSANSGLLAVNLCESRGRRALLGTLARLARGRFAGRRGTRFWAAREASIELESPTALELDGETVCARSAWFDVLPERIRACS